MKKIALWLILAGTALGAKAQQKPHYTQYILNQYIINPALTGIENYTDIKLSHRHQWVGFEDAPVTSYFTFHTAIGKKDYRTTATSFNVEGENPRGKSYWENYTAAEPHHGVGVQIINDRTGPINNFKANVSYAYHLGLSPRTSLAAGFSAGISKIGLDASKLDASMAIDPSVYSSGQINKIRPDLNAGLYLYSADYFVGVSAQQIIPQRIDCANNTVKTEDGRLVPHVFATAGYRFLAGEDFNITPSVMVKFLSNLPVQFDLNTKVQYRDFAWIGAGYRFKDGVTGMVSLNVSNEVNVSYSYDYTTSNLNNYSRGSHEMIVGFIMGNGYGDSCPKNVW